MTLINHTYRFLFVHIPKNAGTSVAMALQPIMGYRDQEIGGTELGQAIAPYFRRRFGIGKHATLREVRSVIGPGPADEYRSFCVIRDPFERAASTYRFLRRWQDWQTIDRWREHAQRFMACATLDEFIDSEFFQTPGPDRLLEPQMSWLEGPSGEPAGIDRMLRLEYLEEELPSLMASFGVPDARRVIRLPHANRSDVRSTNRDLSERSVRILLDRYAADFEHLGYARAPFQP
jgi:hypothetical protein